MLPRNKRQPASPDSIQAIDKIALACIAACPTAVSASGLGRAATRGRHSHELKT
jgi:hypothetical protein